MNIPEPQETNLNIQQGTTESSSTTTPLTPSHTPSTQKVTDLAQQSLEQTSSSAAVTMHLPSQDIRPNSEENLSEEDLAAQSLGKQFIEQTNKNQKNKAEDFFHQKVQGFSPQEMGVNQQDEMAQTPLMHAVYNANMDALKLYCAAGADVNLSDEDGFTPLMAACMMGNEEIIKLLELYGASWTKVDNKGMYAELYLEQSLPGKETDLYRFLKAGEAEKINALPRISSYVNEWAKEHPIDQNDPHSQVIAPRYIYQLVANYVISHQTLMPQDLEFQDIHKLISFLMGNNQYAKKDVLQLLDKGSDLLDDPCRGRVPLALALENNNMDIFNLLIRLGANPENPSISIPYGEYGETLLTYAIDNHAEAVHILLKAGVNPDREGVEGMTPLCLAIRADNSELFDLLIKYKANINITSQTTVMLQFSEIKTHNIDTPLTFAIRSSNAPMVNRLLRAGANTNMPSGGEYPQTPLVIAVSAPVAHAVSFIEVDLLDYPLLAATTSPKGLEIIKILLNQEGINLEIAETAAADSITPLEYAAYHGNQELVAMLAEKGAKITAKALLHPFDVEDLDLIRMLLELNPSLTDKALEIAVTKGNLNIVRILVEERGAIVTGIIVELSRERPEMVDYLQQQL